MGGGWVGAGLCRAAPVSDDPTQPDPAGVAAAVAVSDEAFGVVAVRFRRILELVGKLPATGIASIVGKWPGNETDEEIDKALRELS